MRGLYTDLIVALAGQAALIALEPRDRGLLGLTLRYPYEVRNEAEYFEDIPELKLKKAWP